MKHGNKGYKLYNHTTKVKITYQTGSMGQYDKINKH